MRTGMTPQSTVLVALAAVMVGIAPVSSPLRQTRTIPTGVPKTCPISKSPVRPFVPPSPYPAKTSPHSFWFGTVKLWTSLPTDGTWRGLPHYTPDDPTFRQKLLFWRKGYNWRTESPPRLIVRGRRLDASAPPLAFDGANAGWQDDKEHPFMVTGVNFPTLGCWEVTADYHGDKLTFVVWVAP
jgi:hypothetical protein